jgi:phosphoribosyl-ATP pyrophosphohydrolase
LSQQVILDKLYKIIESRKGQDPNLSYTSQLFSLGRNKIAQKLGEEAIETIIASLAEDTPHVISESADLLYHLLVLWAELGLKPDDIYCELEKRLSQSGLSEKKSRR